MDKRIGRELINALRKRRRSLGLSAYWVDYHLLFGSGIGVSRYECGDRNPSLQKLVDWANVLGCDIRLIPHEENDEGDW